MIMPALYARVSSEKQAQADTIASQVEALKERILADGWTLLEEHQFIDNGYSGSNLVRPALEKLRDQVSAGAIDKIYVHSPDRLSRKYAHQMILTDEFQKSGVDVIFLNFQSDDKPETQLLLQMQGMIAEYERSKIIERHRRGKIHAAKKGSINVLGGAPYGYRYIDKYTGGGQALLAVIEEEAEIIRKIFNWVGKDRISLGEIRRRLQQEGIPTKKGKNFWNKTSILYILRNPTYKGLAGFGKKKIGAKVSQIRPRKGSSEHPKQNFSRYSVDKEHWIYIPVPAIIDENLFEVVQEQLDENKKRARMQIKGNIYLLQGLLMCKHCGRAYYAKKSTKSGTTKVYRYYRCTGSDKHRFGGSRICDNSKQIVIQDLDLIVWKGVKNLLKNPERIFNEYQRRLAATETSPVEQTYGFLEKKKNKIQRGISLLIDSYAQECISKEEFEPRIKAMKENLNILKEQQSKLAEEKNTINEMQLLITNLENFTGAIVSKLDSLDCQEQRDIIRSVVKRIEISENDINIVYKINQLSAPVATNDSAQHRCNRIISPTYPTNAIVVMIGCICFVSINIAEIIPTTRVFQLFHTATTATTIFKLFY